MRARKTVERARGGRGLGLSLRVTLSLESPHIIPQFSRIIFLLKAPSFRMTLGLSNAFCPSRRRYRKSFRRNFDERVKTKLEISLLSRSRC